MLLFLANFASLNMAGVVTFVFQGVRPYSWWEEKKAKRNRHKAIALWLLMLALLVVSIYVERRYLGTLFSA